MDGEEALRTGTAAVSDEWGEEDAGRLRLYEVRAMRRAVVHEVLREDAVSGNSRPARSAVVSSAESAGFDAVEYVSLAESHFIEGSYRGAADALDQLPSEFAGAIRETVEDWRTHSVDPGAVRFRVCVEEEPVAEFRVRGSRRRYWVGLRSERVLSRADPSIGIGRVLLKVAAVVAALALPPYVGGFLFGSTGTALGALVSLIIFLGLVVGAGASSKSVMGVGK